MPVSAPIDDTNTFLGSIDDQLAYIGSFVSVTDILFVSDNPSPWEFAYLGGTTITDRATEGSPYTFDSYIANSYGSSAPDTDSATPNGLPGEEVARLAYFAENYSNPDGASRSAAPDPTATLVGLAAAWRNPTDITIPTLAGSEASGGEGGHAIIAGGSGSTTGDNAGASSASGSGGSTSSASSGNNSQGLGEAEPMDDGGGSQGSHLTEMQVPEGWVSVWNGRDYVFAPPGSFIPAYGLFNRQYGIQTIYVMTSGETRFFNRLGAGFALVGNGLEAAGAVACGATGNVPGAVGLGALATDGAVANINTLKTGVPTTTVLATGVTGALNYVVDGETAQFGGAMVDTAAHFGGSVYAANQIAKLPAALANKPIGGPAAPRPAATAPNNATLGDLTPQEVQEIQSVVDEAGRPLEVVGSAARGTRRGVGTDLPVGKNVGTTRSDIDYLVSSGSAPYYRSIQGKLPSLDPKGGMVPGTHNPYQGPGIRFEPHAPPTFIPQKE
ncbi:MAG: hypothetical protein ACLQIB_34015 [Isosphaeraceae bacterium]